MFCFNNHLDCARTFWFIYLLVVRSNYLGDSFVSCRTFILDYFQGI